MHKEAKTMEMILALKMTSSRSDALLMTSIRSTNSPSQAPNMEG